MHSARLLLALQLVWVAVHAVYVETAVAAVHLASLLYPKVECAVHAELAAVHAA